METKVLVSTEQEPQPQFVELGEGQQMTKSLLGNARSDGGLGDPSAQKTYLLAQSRNQ